MVQLGPTCPGGQPAKGRIRTIAVVLPKKARVLSAALGSPAQPRVPPLGKKGPRIFSFESQRGLPMKELDD